MLTADTLDSESVVRQLDRILADAVFKSSKRSSNLLRYIVEHSLEGGGELLKERLLGAEVFGRPAGYDTSSDHIVRSTAGEIRKRLAQYYLQPGRESEIRIDLPPGSYIAQIRRPASTSGHTVAAPEPDRPLPLQQAKVWPRYWALAIFGIFLAVCISGALYSARSNSRQTSIDRFWQPVLESPVPVVICVGDPRKAWRGSEANAFAGISFSNMPPLPAHPTPVPNLWFYRTVPFADAVTLARLTGLISERKKDYRIVYSPDSTLSDLRQNAALLVGGIDNFWTMNLLRDLRFRFQIDAASKVIFIEDQQSEHRRDWQVPVDTPPNEVRTDYAIVARVVHPVTGRTVLIAGGIRDTGTLAAGEFLTNADNLNGLEHLTRANRNNVEVVLSTTVLKGTPGPPQIVAAYYW